MRTFAVLLTTFSVAVANAIAYPPSLTNGFDAPSISYSKGGHALCVSGKIAVTVSATGTQLSIAQDVNQFQVTDFIQRYLLNSVATVANVSQGP